MKIRHLALALPLALAPAVADCTGDGATKGPSECSITLSGGWIEGTCAKGSGWFRIRYTIEGVGGAGGWYQPGQMSYLFLPGAYNLWIETLTV